MKDVDFSQQQNQDTLRDVFFLQTSKHKDTIYSAKRTQRRNTGLDIDLHKRVYFMSCEYKATVRFITAYSKKLKEEITSIQGINNRQRRTEK